MSATRIAVLRKGARPHTLKITLYRIGQFTGPIRAAYKRVR